MIGVPTTFELVCIGQTFSWMGRAHVKNSGATAIFAWYDNKTGAATLMTQYFQPHYQVLLGG